MQIYNLAPRLINNNLFCLSIRKVVKITWKGHLPFRIGKAVVLDENIGEKRRSQTKEIHKNH